MGKQETLERGGLPVLPSPFSKYFDWWGGRSAAFPFFCVWQKTSCGAGMRHFFEELYVAAFAWIPTVVGMGARLLFWRPLFGACGKVRFGTGIVMQGCANMRIADGVRIGRGCQLYAEGGTLEMGEDAALSPGVTVDASGGFVRIGKQVAVGPGTVLRAANHCFDSLEKPIMVQGHLYGEIVIEDDVWIAANCTITPGTRIGHGAVVGAGAVVTRDVEPYAIVGGVPARAIGSRKDKQASSRP